MLLIVACSYIERVDRKETNVIGRRKFLQLSMIAPVGMLSCKRQEEPFVSKTKRKTGMSEVWRDNYDPRRHDPDDKMLPPGEYWVVCRRIKMKVTAYCACKKCCGRYSDGITASGHVIFKGDRFIAADKMYSFGTWMVVPGYSSHKWMYDSHVRVLDRGGAIKGNHIDVYFDTHQEALNWGVRYLDVTIFMLNEKENKV